MADFALSDEDIAGLPREIISLNDDVRSAPDDFEAWEKLVRSIDNLEGGLNRNSTPQGIAAARSIFDSFLAKFPLFFAYWRKYAELEFAIAGTEAAEYVYERAVASINVSVDLWTSYLSFKVETCHNLDVIRELFERGAEAVGLDFLSHPFWDKYIEFEERAEQTDRIFEILSRIIHIPLHQYARYYDRFRKMTVSRPLEQVIGKELLAQWTSEARMQFPSHEEYFIFEQLSNRLAQQQMAVFDRTQGETNKRWTFEQEIKRPFFHVTELGEDQLSNWTSYLDFEEVEGDLRRISFLYERCLVATAHYDEFWQRYARFMWAHGKTEETRFILARAACFYTPIARPAIRIQWALFEESRNRPDVASAIYESILLVMPNESPVIKNLASLHLRQHGLDAAMDVYQQRLEAPETSMLTKGKIVVDLAQLIFRSTNSVDKARAVFKRHVKHLESSESFWEGWLDFEIAAPLTSPGQESEEAKGIYMRLSVKPTLPPDSVRKLTGRYMEYLVERGGKGAAGKWLELDCEVRGSEVLRGVVKGKAGVNGGGH